MKIMMEMAKTAHNQPGCGDACGNGHTGMDRYTDVEQSNCPVDASSFSFSLVPDMPMHSQCLSNFLFLYRCCL